MSHHQDSTKPAPVMRPTLRVKLAMWAFDLFPRVVSPDDESHAAFFEPSHLKHLVREKIDAALHSAAHNRRFAEEQSPFLEPFFSPSIKEYFKGKRVLDFGSAIGGTAIAWEGMYETATVSGFDVTPIFVEGATKYAKSADSAADFRHGYGEQSPFADGSFDTIVAIDVLEHVYDFEQCLRECSRMLVQGGHLIAVFPPFLHPYEHHIKVSRTPFVHWIFSGETLRLALNEVLRRRGPQFAHFHAEHNPNYKIPDLNGITVRRARKAFRDQGWVVVKNERHGVPKVGRRAQTPLLRMISRVTSVFARVPLLDEVFLDRIAVVLRKA